MTTFLKTLRLYPGFDGLNLFKTGNRRFQLAYQQLNRQYVLIDAQIKAEALANPKEKKKVIDWNTLYRKIIDRYPRGTKEHLYIRLYNEYPSRDDFKNLFIDDRSTPPSNDRERDRVNKNTIFINGSRAVIVLSDYKTVKIYGKSMFKFSKDVTDELKEYINANKKDLSSKLLFGPSSMSQFVANILDSIGAPENREGQINYLRKSFISTEMEKVKDNAEERLLLAHHFRHSPSASLKYIRDVTTEFPESNTDKVPFELSKMTTEQLELFQEEKEFNDRIRRKKKD